MSLLALLPALSVPASAEPPPAAPEKPVGAVFQQVPAGASGKQAPVNAASSTVAKPFEKPYGSHLQPILENISATDVQRQKITLIVQTYRPRIEPLRQEYKQKSKEFIEFLCSGKPAEAIMARQGELNGLYGVIITEYGMMRLEIRKLLTPEQCVRFEDYRRRQGWRK